MIYNLKKILKKVDGRDFNRYLKIENDVTSIFNKDTTALVEIRTDTRTLNKNDVCYSKKQINKMKLRPGKVYIKCLNKDIKQFYDLIEDYRLVKISFNNYNLKIKGYKKDYETKILLETHLKEHEINESFDVDVEYYTTLSTSILKQFKKILVDEYCLKFYLSDKIDGCFKIESCNSELNIFIAPVIIAWE